MCDQPFFYKSDNTCDFLNVFFFFLFCFFCLCVCVIFFFFLLFYFVFFFCFFLFIFYIYIFFFFFFFFKAASDKAFDLKEGIFFQWELILPCETRLLFRRKKNDSFFSTASVLISLKTYSTELKTILRTLHTMFRTPSATFRLNPLCSKDP